MKEERREAIKELLRVQGEVKLKDLEEQFQDCSSMTLRRDLKYLEDHGYVKRTRGGAVAMSQLSPAVEDLYSERALENVAEKNQIARKAQQFVSKGRSIYIDSGTTMMLFTREMADEHLTVLTSGVNIAMELLKKQRPQITLIGGQVNRSTISVSGISAASLIQEVNIDTAFIAASGYSQSNGFTSGSYTVCEIKREVLRRARQRIVLMDSLKVDRVMAFTFAGMQDIDVLITDDGLPDAVMRRARECGVEVI